MTRTGHYEWDTKLRKFVKVSDTASIQPHVHFNRGNVPHFDPSARTTFQSRQHKREWLKANGMKEGGVIRRKDEDKIVSRCKLSKV